MVTTLLVFAYSLLREGITPDTRIAGMTLLDQVNHRAATIGVAAFYCPLTPSSGLHFDFGTEASPLVTVGYGSGGSSREVDWSTGYLFTPFCPQGDYHVDWFYPGTEPTKLCPIHSGLGPISP